MIRTSLARIALGVFFCGATFVAAPSAPAAQSVDDAMEAASTRDLGVARAALAAEQARLGVTEARAASWPSVDLNASLVRNRDEIEVDGRVFVNRYDYDASLLARVDLIDPSDWPSRREAAHRLDAARARAAFERSAVRLEAARAFFDVLEQRALRDARLQDRLVRQTSLDALALLEAGGDVRQVDVDRARLELLRTEASLLEAEQRLLSTRLILQERTGWSDIDVDALVVAPIPDAMVVGDVASSERRARQDDVAASERRARALRWDRAPSVSLTARTLFGRASLRAPNGVDWTLTLSFQWALFDPLLGARIRSAELEAERASLWVERFDEERRMSGASAAAGLAVASEQLRVARESIPVAENVRRITLALLEEGEATPLELAEADAALAQARTEAVTAEAAWWRAYTERRWLAGELEDR